MHAYGMPPTSTQSGYVNIDGFRFIGPTNRPLVRLTIAEAEKLQRQLGVAIREAVGQTELVPRTHADESDRP